MQFLIFSVTDGHDQPATFRKLRTKRLRNGRRRCGNQNCVEWGKFRETQRTVATVDMHIRKSKSLQPRGGGRGKFRSGFDGKNYSRKVRKNGGLIPAPRPDLQDAFFAG